MDVNEELSFCENSKKIAGWGWVGGSGWGVGLGGQAGCERRIEVFVEISTTKKIGRGSGWGGGQGGGVGFGGVRVDVNENWSFGENSKKKIGGGGGSGGRSGGVVGLVGGGGWSGWM